MEINAISVKQLNQYVRSLLDGNVHLANVTVTGELSNFKNHYASGHFYFSLKDKDALIKCIMFRTYASEISFIPKDGMSVVIRGRVTLYEKEGTYQLYAEQMMQVGVGDLALKFEQIKEKLLKEGLFNSESKRVIPRFPKNIAVVTSETGAAVRDVINIISRRWPICNIILCPVSVQGEKAANEMSEALDILYKKSIADLIIIGRGGGSAEDLSAFNDEGLARKIYESPVPVISAVGHETDYTISDFVADLRAPTPSAAAELSTPNIEDIIFLINKHLSQMKNALTAKYDYSKSKLQTLISSSYFKFPEDTIINLRLQQTDSMFDALINAYKTNTSNKETKFLTDVARLESLSPLKVLSRGYSIAQKQGKTINSILDVNMGDNIDLTFKDGKISCSVTERIDSFE